MKREGNFFEGAADVLLFSGGSVSVFKVFRFGHRVGKSVSIY
jgi:hypothetical protein